MIFTKRGVGEMLVNSIEALEEVLSTLEAMREAREKSGDAAGERWARNEAARVRRLCATLRRKLSATLPLSAAEK